MKEIPRRISLGIAADLDDLLPQSGQRSRNIGSCRRFADAAFSINRKFSHRISFPISNDPATSPLCPAQQSQAFHRDSGAQNTLRGAEK